MVVAIANTNIPFTKMNELNSTAERKNLLDLRKTKSSNIIYKKYI